MSNDQKYLHLAVQLKTNDYNPAICTFIDLKGQRITSLEVKCQSIRKNEILEAVRKAIGDKFVSDYIPNKEVIEIRIKK